MTELDLRAAAAVHPLELPGADALGEADRAHALHEWRGRMVAEHASARVFGALVGQLMRAGVDPERQAEAAAMVGQELRHARLCAAVVHALGGEARAPLPPLPEVPLHPRVDPREGLLRNLLSICCLEETVAVALLEAGRARVSAPALREVVASILADEVGHARFGWDLCEELLDGAPPALRARLSAYLTPAFRHLFERYGQPCAPVSSPAAMAVGACGGSEDRVLFLRTVDEAILPGLERLGLSASSALSRLAA